MVSILTIWRLIFTAGIITFTVAASRAGASEIISEVIPLKYAKAEEVAALLDQSTPAVALDIIADIRSNSLLVFGSKEQIETVKRKALTADVPLSQILIEAAVLELELPRSQKDGVQHEHSTATIGCFLGSSICWSTNLVHVVPTNCAGDEQGAFTYVAGLDNGFSSTVAALIEEHRVRVIQKPRIQTLSGVPASLFIGETVPYVHGTGYVNSGSPHSCRPQLKMGIQLEITPVIESDGAISIDIKSTVERKKLTGVSDLPDTTTTQSTVSAMVRNGDMLLVGGATQTRKQRFPPVPGRGTLNDRSNRPRRTELVILLRFAVLSPDRDHLGAK